MAYAISGFTATSAENLWLGPGAVFADYGLTSERPLGMTNGGTSFNPGVTYRDIESDRLFTSVKGLRVIDEVNPTITANLMEMSVENLKTILPGLIEVPYTTEEITETPSLANYTRLKLGDLTEDSYLSNIAVVARTIGNERPVICIVHNALPSGEIEISLENKSEATVEVTFSGNFLPADLEALADGSKTLDDVVPFEVRYPVADTNP